jgi:FKBP-type peptidyl-prolyl cis-trans isomerase FkpA
VASLRDWRKRIVAILAAGLFLITSLGFSFLVIYQIHKDSQQNKINAGLQEALKQAQIKKQTPTNTSTTKKEGKLEGTQLATFTPVASVSSLSSTDTIAGTGAEVKASDTITAHYTGALASTGVIFQSSLDSGQPFTSPLSGLIKGWQVGIPGMKVGGTRRLLIPAAQAYGSQAQSGIPANSDLVFDIQLISIK